MDVTGCDSCRIAQEEELRRTSSIPSACVLPEHPAAGEHGAFERRVDRVSEGAAAIKGGSGWGARQGCRTTQHPVQRKDEGLDQVLPPVISLQWREWTTLWFHARARYGLGRLFCTCKTKQSALTDELRGWHRMWRSRTRLNIFQIVNIKVWLTMWNFTGHQTYKSTFTVT